MAIPTILKGDTSAPICFTAPETAARLLAKYQGVVRTFEHVAQGDQLSIRFTAEESAAFKLGTSPIYFAAGYADGRVKTYPISAKIKVTDSPALVYGSTLDVDPGADGGKPLDGVDALPELHTMDDMAAKLNEIIHKLGGGAAAILLTLCLSALGASVQTAPLGALRNDAQIVTNVTFSGLAPADYETVSNRAMSAVQPAEMNAAIAAIPSTDLTPATNYTDAALASATTNLARSVADRYLPLSGGIVRGNLQIGYAADNYAVGQRFVRVDVGGISIDEISDVQYIDVTGVDDQGREIHTMVPIPRAFSTPVWLQLPTNSGHIARTEDILLPVTTAKEEAFDYTDSAITATTNQLSSFAAHTNDTSNPHNVTASQIGAAPASLAQDVADLRTESALIYRLYSGSNVVFEVTNYNSQVHAPSMRLLQLNESNEYITVWTETNGLSRTLASARGYTDAATNALPATYAPRAWGRTTSGLGADAPDGTTWISTSNTVIAGGLEYQKNVTSAGAIWILTSNGMSADFHQQSNNVAYLDMSAADGTPIFRVEKTDSFLVGVHCDAVHVEDGDTLVCGVGVVANSHPYVRVRQSLTSGSWAKEEDGIPAGLATVEWSGTSGAWTCRIRNMTGGNALFACMEYMQEGGVKVVNSAAMDVSTGGILCTDGVHKVRPVYNNGAITWEVVP